MSNIFSKKSEMEAVAELKTIGDFVRWGASRFKQATLTFGHGTDNAFDDAFYLVCSVLHLPHDLPSYMFQSALTTAEKQDVVKLLVERIETRKPAAYLTKEAWFAGLPYYVDERVLVPRSPIAELIQHRFEPWIEGEQVRNILEIGTGSGCIAIACALAFPQAHTLATDISEAALAVAEINLARYSLQDRIKLLQADVFESVDTNIKFDIIVSNPPYVDAADMAALTEEYKQEPALALAAGSDGLDIVRRILRQTGDYLSPHGILVVEAGNSAEHLLIQYPEIPFIWPEFERGGSGVFILSGSDLAKYKDNFNH
jgi:ribosomal protein L3 glutamine methyltransferase